jgi:hypothetical protein
VSVAVPTVADDAAVTVTTAVKVLPDCCGVPTVTVTPDGAPVTFTLTVPVKSEEPVVTALN